MLELRLNEVSKKFRENVVVNPLSFTFHNGVYGLLGANGAGKTTLLRMIAGILPPTSGDITLNDVRIEKMDGEYRRLLGYLPQQFGFYPEFTAERYLRYLGQLKAVPPRLLPERMDQLFWQTGLEQVRGQKIKTFSGGMLRRLGIAQALLNEPEILILDEPTSGLDPRERIRFRNLISSLGRERLILLSSHIVTDFEAIADVMILMKGGGFLETGKLETVLKIAEGKVWECLVTPDTAALLDQKYHIRYLHNEAEMARVRIVSEVSPLEGAELVKPNLEDVYLYYFGDQEVNYGTVSNGIL